MVRLHTLRVLQVVLEEREAELHGGVRTLNEACQIAAESSLRRGGPASMRSGLERIRGGLEQQGELIDLLGKRVPSQRIARDIHKWMRLLTH